MSYRSKPQISMGMSLLLALQLFFNERVIVIRQQYSNDQPSGTRTSGIPFHRYPSTCEDDAGLRCSNTQIWSTYRKHMMIAAFLSARYKKQQPDAYQQNTFTSTLKASIFNCITDTHTPILLNNTVTNTIQEISTRNAIDESTQKNLYLETNQSSCCMHIRLDVHWSQNKVVTMI